MTFFKLWNIVGLKKLTKITYVKFLKKPSFVSNGQFWHDCAPKLQAYTCHDPKMAHLHNSGYALKIFKK